MNVIRVGLYLNNSQNVVRCQEIHHKLFKFGSIDTYGAVSKCVYHEHYSTQLPLLGLVGRLMRHETMADACVKHLDACDVTSPPVM